jgi:hypothetical protein
MQLTSTHPKVVWEDFTYPNVACLGAILKHSKLCDEATTVLSNRREATMVECRVSTIAINYVASE